MSKITTEFISSQMNESELKENLINLCSGKVESLKMKEANLLNYCYELVQSFWVHCLFYIGNWRINKLFLPNNLYSGAKFHPRADAYIPLSLSFFFQSQVGHSLIIQLASLLSPKINCMHYDVTRQCFFRGAKY